ncbi:bcl-2/adenovirus E1B 19 kDa-interacting protein 2-like protein isoform X4 [Phalacrocorax aristotelis]|uniref:bcl-2/adenovirus E1B 19 kDa-interacting protein 2-like protein isoform X4 n=1 Tax=Phalacrocorax aristotelis TaxID=126867 RepID=UPI003F4B7253
MRSGRTRTSPGPCQRGAQGLGVPRGACGGGCQCWSGPRALSARPTPASTSTWTCWRRPQAATASSGRVRLGRGGGAGDPRIPPPQCRTNRVPTEELPHAWGFTEGAGGRRVPDTEDEWLEESVDLSAVEPYSRVLSHGGKGGTGPPGWDSGSPPGACWVWAGDGCWLCHPPLWAGYHGEGFGSVLLFAACHLPDSSIPRYGYVMENLLRYITGTLERTVADRYVLVCLSGAAARAQIPSFGWMKRCYRAMDRR